MTKSGSIVSLAVLAGSILLWTQDASTFDTRGYPADMVEAARLTERRCTKCHALSRVTDAPLAGDEWTDVVQEMAKKEKSGISERESATIAAFLAYRSAKGSGAGAAPRASALHPESLPAVFGATGAYSRPASAVFASAPLPATAAFPATIELAGTKVSVQSAGTQSGPAGLAKATARVAVDGRETDLELSRTDGKYTASDLTLRSWSIGPYSFRLVLAVYQADPAVTGEARGDLVLALVVIRVK